MNKTLVRVLCAVLGFLMVSGMLALIVSGLVTACENAKAEKKAESQSAAIVYDIGVL